MRILTTLTYFSPHISGLTIYARRLVRRLVQDGHQVTVLTSRYDRGLPAREVIDGATIVRSPVLMRVSKGALMPLLPFQAAKLVREHDLVHLYLPQFEGAVIAATAKAMRRPVVTTYACDIELPPGMTRRVFTPAIRASHYLTGKLSDRIVVVTKGYGESARLSRRFHEKVVSVYPPIELSDCPCEPQPLRERMGAGRRPLIGFVGRFAEEKGIEFLLNSATSVLRAFPNARYVIVGPTDQVPGERVHARLAPVMAALGPALIHLGVLSDRDLRLFYESIDVLALPSINSTESFGMTQAEAMLAGTPVVASDLPGVREAIDVTGMGRLVRPADAEALADALIEVLRNPECYIRPPSEVRQHFGSEKTAAFYEDLFAGLMTKRALEAPQPSPANLLD